MASAGGSWHVTRGGNRYAVKRGESRQKAVSRRRRR